jgi:hypothetical protein
MYYNVLDRANKNGTGNAELASQYAEKCLRYFSELFATFENEPEERRLHLIEYSDDYVRLLLVNGKVKKAEAFLAQLLKQYSHLTVVAKSISSHITFLVNQGDIERARNWYYDLLIHFSETPAASVAKKQYAGLFQQSLAKMPLEEHFGYLDDAEKKEHPDEGILEKNGSQRMDMTPRNDGNDHERNLEGGCDDEHEISAGFTIASISKVIRLIILTALAFGVPLLIYCLSRKLKKC